MCGIPRTSPPDYVGHTILPFTDGYFTFHSFPVVSETTNPKKVDDTTTVMRYIATCDNPDNFDDSMFDDYLGDVLRPHAPLLSGDYTSINFRLILRRVP